MIGLTRAGSFAFLFSTPSEHQPRAHNAPAGESTLSTKVPTENPSEWNDHHDDELDRQPAKTRRSITFQLVCTEMRTRSHG